MSLMMEAIDRHVPMAKASQYAKRWWTEDLTALRSEYTQQRNQSSRARCMDLILLIWKSLHA